MNVWVKSPIHIFLFPLQKTSTDILFHQSRMNANFSSIFPAKYAIILVRSPVGKWSRYKNVLLFRQPIRKFCRNNNKKVGSPVFRKAKLCIPNKRSTQGTSGLKARGECLVVLTNHSESPCQNNKKNPTGILRSEKPRLKTQSG